MRLTLLTLHPIHPRAIVIYIVDLFVIRHMPL